MVVGSVCVSSPRIYYGHSEAEQACVDHRPPASASVPAKPSALPIAQAPAPAAGMLGTLAAFLLDQTPIAATGLVSGGSGGCLTSEGDTTLHSALCPSEADALPAGTRVIGRESGNCALVVNLTSGGELVSGADGLRRFSLPYNVPLNPDPTKRFKITIALTPQVINECYCGQDGAIRVSNETFDRLPFPVSDPFVQPPTCDSLDPENFYPPIFLANYQLTLEGNPTITLEHLAPITNPLDVLNITTNRETCAGSTPVLLCNYRLGAERLNDCRNYSSFNFGPQSTRSFSAVSAYLTFNFDLIANLSFIQPVAGSSHVVVIRVKIEEDNN